jgi:hypothetical protein
MALTCSGLGPSGSQMSMATSPLSPGPTGGVESREEYGPWGEQFSGSGLEMGYLGAWERPTDPPVGCNINRGCRAGGPC